MKIINFCYLAIFLGVTLSLSSQACLHFDAKFKRGITEGTKVALLFHDGTSAHLVVRTDLKSNRGLLPNRIAWVMPFPKMPSHYEEVPEQIFRELELALTPSLQDSLKARGANSWAKPAAKNSFLVHPTRTVGDHKITPIEIVSVTDGKEFNDWLIRQRFNPMPLEKQKPYLKPGAVFLAIEARLKAKEATLKPLHITYPDDRLSFPLRFTHDTRTFAMELFVVTPKALDPLKEIPLFFDLRHEAPLPDSTLRKAKFPALFALLGERVKGHLTHFSSEGINTAEKRLSQLEEDPYFRLAAK